jgi:ubiquinone/menaquinone biosynthesis C-methylase UbiE
VKGKELERQKEINGLKHIWEDLPANYLRNYLVEGLQCPIINLASVLVRHELLRLIDQFNPDQGIWKSSKPLRIREIKFAKKMTAQIAENKRQMRYSLFRRAFNKGGRILRRTFFSHQEIPGAMQIRDDWRRFSDRCYAAKLSKPTVLECACGSANDYRYMESYGLAMLVDYTGIDLVETNVKNALSLFPSARFFVGDVTRLEYEDSRFDCTIIFDLFEHLHPQLMEEAFSEIIRVTRQELVLTFFNMTEVNSHIINPVESYYWNTLSKKQIMLSLNARPEVAGIEIKSIFAINPIEFNYEKAENENNWVWTIMLSKL